MRMPRLWTAFFLLFWPVSALAAPAAPAFTLPRLDGGGTLDSRSFIGRKALLVRFQASWCKVCAEEAPRIERIWATYGPLGVEVIGIQIQDTEADARKFLAAHAATYPAGLDPRLRIANRFGVKGTPYTVIIDKRGEISARIAGRADEARLARLLEALLKEPPRRKPPARLR
jgi:cytochrome c biogenesis protein CcmG/thiol:disulfide interchange protein DsbE